MKRSIGISKMKLLNVYHLNALGYDPTSVVGFFLWEQRPLEIVRRFPHLHIISATEGDYLNYYSPGHEAYFVSAGDPDPELEVVAEAFNHASYNEFEAMLKSDKGEITDPFLLMGLKLLRTFVSEKNPWEEERLRKKRAAREARRNRRTQGEEPAKEPLWLPVPPPKH